MPEGSVPNRMIVRRIMRVMENKPERLGLTFVAENQITALEIATKLPMFQSRGVTVEQIAIAIAAITEDNKLTITDGVITFTPSA